MTIIRRACLSLILFPQSILAQQPAAWDPARLQGQAAKLSEAARAQAERRERAKRELPAQIHIELELADTASEQDPIGASYGFPARLGDVGPLRESLAQLRELKKDGRRLSLLLTRTEGEPPRYAVSSDGLTADDRASWAQVTFHDEPRPLAELRLRLVLKGERGVELRTYLGAHAGASPFPIEFGPGFTDPRPRGRLELTGDHRVDGGYEVRDYPVSLAGARLIRFETR